MLTLFGAWGVFVDVEGLVVVGVRPVAGLGGGGFGVLRRVGLFGSAAQIRL